MEHLPKEIESVLIWKAEPVSKKKLASLLECTNEEIESAVETLKQLLQGRGVILLEKDGELEIRTSPETSTTIEKLQREELARDLGKSGLETLTIILYQGPISRRDIDYIRGVNSTFILRNLQIRGLIEKVANPDDQRSFLYKPTFDLLGHLGITKMETLPEYDAFKKELESFKNKIEVEEASQGVVNGEISPNQE